MKNFGSIVLFLGFALCAAQVSASNTYMARQAYELEAMSHKIASELRHSGQHRSLQREAEQLARQAERFRDAVDRQHEHRYVQARYRELTTHYSSFERRYKRTHLGSRYNHLHRHYSSLNTLYFGLSTSFISYSNAYSHRARAPERVIIYQSSPSRRYEPFGLQHRALGNRNHDRDRARSHNRSRHDSHDRHRNADRGRRNHYK